MNDRVYRILCPKCGSVLDIAGEATCKCGTRVTPAADGMIRIHRKKQFLVAATACTIYLNDTPIGRIKSGETVNIPAPYGAYDLRITAGLRKCKPLTVCVSDDEPLQAAMFYMPDNDLIVKLYKVENYDIPKD